MTWRGAGGSAGLTCACESAGAAMEPAGGAEPPAQRLLQVGARRAGRLAGGPLAGGRLRRAARGASALLLGTGGSEGGSRSAAGGRSWRLTAAAGRRSWVSGPRRTAVGCGARTTRRAVLVGGSPRSGPLGKGVSRDKWHMTL